MNNKELIQMALDELEDRNSDRFYEATRNVCAILEAALAQPEKEWVGLTDDERQEIYDCYGNAYGLMKEVEAKLKDKNT